MNQDRDDHRLAEPQTAPQRSPAARSEPKTIRSLELFAGATEIGIEHAGALYRLKITRQGKLILNK